MNEDLALENRHNDMVGIGYLFLAGKSNIFSYRQMKLAMTTPCPIVAPQFVR